MQVEKVMFFHVSISQNSQHSILKKKKKIHKYLEMNWTKCIVHIYLYADLMSITVIDCKPFFFLNHDLPIIY